VQAGRRQGCTVMRSASGQATGLLEVRLHIHVKHMRHDNSLGIQIANEASPIVQEQRDSCVLSATLLLYQCLDASVHHAHNLHELVAPSEQQSWWPHLSNNHACACVRMCGACV